MGKQKTQPWLKFYPSDWRSDPRLRMCSLAARGLWMEMIALMHEAQPYGHLVVSGNAPTDAQLAVLAGTTPDQIPELLGELESAGVFSRTSKSVIYSRRMTRDDKKARLARKNGQRGGNPSIGDKRENRTRDNPEDKGQDKAQRPEARGQREKDPADAGSKKTHGARLPDDWVLPDDWAAWARAEGHANPELEAEKFRDYWHAQPGQRGRKADWEATWRNWIRKSLESGHGKRPDNAKRQQPAGNPYLAAVRDDATAAGGW